VLKRKSGFFTFTSICLVLNGDNVDPPEDTVPEICTSDSDAERSCSAYKHILSDKGQSMTPEYMEMILIVYCASKNQ
jgi:hypothetical protein